MTFSALMAYWMMMAIGVLFGSAWGYTRGFEAARQRFMQVAAEHDLEEVGRLIGEIEL